MWSGGLVRNLHLGAGTGFDVGGLGMVGFMFGDVGGLEMVGFMFGDVGGLEMVGFMFGSDSIVTDGPEMFGSAWKSGCCSAGDADDGLVMVGFV